jgi:hypothetical protein
MSEDLSSLFGGGNNSAISILKDLLDQDNIVIKSQVTMKQIRSLLRVKWESERQKPENKTKRPIQIIQDEIVPYYLALKCSYLRKSRSELLDALKQLNEKFIEKEQGMLPGVNGGK